MTAEVSVVLPTRDRLPFLPASIGSVLAQDHEDLELIVVDDGSTDDTIGYLSSLDDPRLRVVHHPVSSGPAAARNRGIELAVGELIAFQDSDDVWRPEKLRRDLDALRQTDPGCVVTYSPVEMPGAGMIPGACDPIRHGDLSTVLARHNIVALPAAVVRTRALRSAGGFDERLHRLEDWDLFLSLSKLGSFSFVDDVLVDVGVGNDRVTRRVPEYFDAVELILEKHAGTFDSVPQIRVALEGQVLRHAVASRQMRRAVRLSARMLAHPGTAVGGLFTRVKHGSPLARGRHSGYR
jgi:glycosyltransferase involved in cell wall biosynthesis